jgi:hypothetical protein
MKHKLRQKKSPQQLTHGALQILQQRLFHQPRRPLDVVLSSCGFAVIAEVVRGFWKDIEHVLIVGTAHAVIAIMSGPSESKYIPAGRY